jgi:YQGE family putative transporter
MKNFLINEIKHLQILSAKARRLILSYTFQGAAYILIHTLINAYIWRYEGDIIAIIKYNFGNFISLPVAFYLNGILLKKIRINNLYLIGSCLVGFGAMLVVSFSKFFPSYLLFGLIYGLGSGFYWANRNYLTISQTESNNRNYFIGLNFSLDTITSIIIPFLAGWFIFFGNQIGSRPYIIIILIAFLLLLLAGIIVNRDEYSQPEINKMAVYQPSVRWRAVRYLTIAIGIIEGLSFFLPIVIILNNLGHEGILGSVNSLIAVLSALIYYLYGRKTKIKDRIPIYIISLIIGLLASCFLFIGLNKLSVFIFVTLYSLSIMFVWLTTDPLVMDVIDKEVKHGAGKMYAYVFDRELFLNIGRWISMGIGLLILFLFDQTWLLLMGPLVTYLTHFCILYIIRQKKYQIFCKF